AGGRSKRATPQANQLKFSFIEGLEGFDVDVIESWKEWDDLEVLSLMEYMIYRSFQIVKRKGANTDSFAEELAWIFNDEIKPFSFENCCNAASLDFRELREGLYRSLDEEKQLVVSLLTVQQVKKEFRKRG